MKTPATTARRSSRSTPVPASLLALCAMFDEFEVAEIQNALAVAEKALAHFVTHGNSADGLGAHSHTPYDDIGRAAETGTYRAAVKQAFAIGLEGDLINAFGQPAFLAGVCCAWIMLTGGRR
jgi:hypothetical protein